LGFLEELYVEGDFKIVSAWKPCTLICSRSHKAISKDMNLVSAGVGDRASLSLRTDICTLFQHEGQPLLPGLQEVQSNKQRNLLIDSHSTPAGQHGDPVNEGQPLLAGLQKELLHK
jgi:hypothetical protein